MNTLARIHSPIEVYCLKLDYKCTVKCIGKFVFGCWNFLLVANALSFVGSTHFLTPQCLKITKNVAFQVFVFSTNFCPIKSDMSGNTV